MRTMNRIVHFIENMNKSMFYVIGAITIFLGFFVCFEVFSRYLFNKPTRFGYDLVEWLIGIAAFLGGGYALLTNAHIRVDVFYEKYSVKTRRIVEVFSNILALIMAVTIVWVGTEYVLTLYERGSSGFNGLKIAGWVKWLVFPIGGFMIGLQALALLIKDIYLLVTDKPSKFVTDQFWEVKK